jgi:hypothetical protein
MGLPEGQRVAVEVAAGQKGPALNRGIHAIPGHQKIDDFRARGGAHVAEVGTGALKFSHFSRFLNGNFKTSGGWYFMGKKFGLGDLEPAGREQGNW